MTFHVWMRSLRSLRGHLGSTCALLAHPHLPILVASTVDPVAIWVWDLETRRCLRTLEGHALDIYCLALDPAGRRLASGSSDRTLRLWDLDSGACLRTLVDEPMSDFCALAWDASGTLIASGSFNPTVRVWDAASGVLRHALTGHSGGVSALAAHPFDDLLASGSDDQCVRVWRWSTGECCRTLAGHSGYVSSLAASAAFLVSAAGDETVRVWSWTSEACVRVLDRFESCCSLNCLAWRDSTLVTLESDRSVRVWDASSAEDPREWSCLGSLPSKASNSSGVAVMGGGSVACAAPKDSRTISVWEV